MMADADGIAQAAAVIAEGGCVAVPTETVYGLAADATNGEAVAGIYAAKGRPSFNPLIVHVPDLAAAMELAELDTAAVALAEAHWPGPLTLVLPLKTDAPIASLVTAGLSTIAIASRHASLAQGQWSPACCPFRQCQWHDQPDPRRACCAKP
jgi:L-threonylcarbamoyladenylate synthase